MLFLYIYHLLHIAYFSYQNAGASGGVSPHFTLGLSLSLFLFGNGVRGFGSEGRSLVLSFNSVSFVTRSSAYKPLESSGRRKLRHTV